jgi:hypothetical protein
LTSFEIASQAVISALIAGHEDFFRNHSRRSRRGRARCCCSSERSAGLKRCCNAFIICCFTSFARADAFAAVEAVGAADALLLAPLTGFLELGWDDELAVEARVVARCTWILVTVFDERTVVVAYFEACSAASALGVTECELIDCEAVISVHLLVVRNGGFERRTLV